MLRPNTTHRRHTAAQRAIRAFVARIRGRVRPRPPATGIMRQPFTV
jgi:hypothetical protein